MQIRSYFILFILIVTSACQNGSNQADQNKSEQQTYAKAVVDHFDQNKLSDYWYKGEAEITHYELQQNRYGDVHPGEVISIFVTEDFLTDQQVKNDHYQSQNSVSVLKNNLALKFQTGLYDYSIMTSTFTPVNNKDWPATLKVTNSSQDWCGQSFMQLNYRNDAYQMKLHSYFETEGDVEKEVGKAILEDEIMNRIRINPKGLPTGGIQVFPSTTIVRLKHLTFEPLKAQASLKAYTGQEFSGEALMVYTLNYPEMKRTYEVIFEDKAPYRIVGWKDAYPSMFDDKERITIAKATKTIMSPYWQKNSPEDRALRAVFE